MENETITVDRRHRPRIVEKDHCIKCGVIDKIRIFDTINDNIINQLGMLKTFFTWGMFVTWLSIIGIIILLFMHQQQDLKTQHELQIAYLRIEKLQKDIEFHHAHKEPVKEQKK
jgi:hypothetical protein